MSDGPADESPLASRADILGAADDPSPAKGSDRPAQEPSRRSSVVRAQLLAMRQQAEAIASVSLAFVAQLDSMLVMTDAMEAIARPTSAAVQRPDEPPKTFGAKRNG